MNENQLATYLGSETEQYLCVFCMTEVGSFSCYQCGEYKGVMNRKDAKEYLGEDFFSEED